MEPTATLTRVAAMRRAMAASSQDYVWRRVTRRGDQGVREAHRGEESNGSELDRCPSLHRGGDPIAEDAGHGEGAAVSGISERGPAPGFRWN